MYQTRKRRVEKNELKYINLNVFTNIFRLIFILVFYKGEKVQGYYDFILFNSITYIQQNYSCDRTELIQIIPFSTGYILFMFAYD